MRSQHSTTRNEQTFTRKPSRVTQHFCSAHARSYLMCHQQKWNRDNHGVRLVEQARDANLSNLKFADDVLFSVNTTPNMSGIFWWNQSKCMEWLVSVAPRPTARILVASQFILFLKGEGWATKDSRTHTKPNTTNGCSQLLTASQNFCWF